MDVLCAAPRESHHRFRCFIWPHLALTLTCLTLCLHVFSVCLLSNCAPSVLRHLGLSSCGIWAQLRCMHSRACSLNSCCAWAWTCSRWDIRSQTRDRTPSPLPWEHRVLSTRPPGSPCVYRVFLVSCALLHRDCL